jgi:hypothetical protein
LATIKISSISFGFSKSVTKITSIKLSAVELIHDMKGSIPFGNPPIGTMTLSKGFGLLRRSTTRIIVALQILGA